MKRLTAILTMIIVCVSLLTGCGNSQGSQSAGSADNSPKETTSEGDPITLKLFHNAVVDTEASYYVDAVAYDFHSTWLRKSTNLGKAVS